MAESTESREGVDCALSPTSDRYWSTGWRILRQSEVGSIFMVVAHILGHQPLEMAFIQHDHVIVQISKAASYPALRNTVLPRGAEGSPDGVASDVVRQNVAF
jgi:hypothetical protein